MKNILFAVLLCCVPAGAQQLSTIQLGIFPSDVRCFFQNGVTNAGQSYWGNSVTHDNIYMPPKTEVMAAYQHLGNNAAIFDGPLFHVGTQCLLTSVTYFTGPDPNTDTYHQHFICRGTGSTNQQGATVTTTPPAVAGPCAPGDVAVGYTNTYDVGLYCVSNTVGECVYGELYCSVGPLPYNVAAPGAMRVATFNCVQGSVMLPEGDYGVMMATNCDSGSIAAAGGIGASAGFGSARCLTGYGEAGPYGTGGSGDAYAYTSQLYAWKYFVFPAATALPHGGHCLLYDALHDNSVGLPPTLTAYDNGGCNLVNTGQVAMLPAGQAPHTIGFTWWSTI